MTDQHTDGKRPLRLEKSCPLPITHTRLHDAHRHWHRALDSYSDPDGFCVDLTGAIQTFRSVTNMLQKEKRRIPDFKEWYVAPGGWRNRMEADPLLAWLDDARTQFFHRGNLETHSTARVRVTASWDEAPWTEFRVSPFATAAEIAASFDLSELPESIRRDGLLEVERRWVADDLPDHELLETLAHCYGVYATILREAHERCGFRMQTFSGEDHEGEHHRTEHLGGRLPCMLTGRERRTAWLHLTAGELLVSEERSRTYSRDDIEDLEPVARRYGMPTAAPDVDVDADLFDHAESFNEMAKRVLVTDKMHRTTVILLLEDEVEILAADPADQQGKYLLMDDVAKRVEVSGAAGIVHITQAWGASMLPENHPHAQLRPEGREDHFELLKTTVAAMDGRTRAFLTRFSRVDGAIVLEPTFSEDGPYAPFLEPVRRAWARRSSR